MLVPSMVVSVWVLMVLVGGALKFLHDTHGTPHRLLSPRALLGATIDSLVLRYLRGGQADGCTYPAERPSQARRWLHMLAFYGFLSALASTISAFILQHWFEQWPPYPVLSIPVVLGSLGGVAMIVGCSGLLWLKGRSDREPADERSMSLDWLFLAMLNIVSITGMLLLVLRETPAMGSLLILHIATVLGLYASTPYGKFAHFVYRFAALLQHRLESLTARHARH
jgi:citrate/tricarballylate utilization protein